MSEATPYKTGANDLDLYKRLVMDSVFQRKLDGNPFEDVTIQQFVEDIWGLDPKIITDTLAVEWVLKESAVTIYDTVAQTDTKLKFQAPFHEIVDELLV